MAINIIPGYYSSSPQPSFGHPGYDKPRNKEWRTQMAQYYMNKAYADNNARHINNSASKALFMATVDTSKAPAFATTDDGSPRSVEYEYINSVYKPIMVQLGEKSMQGYELHAKLVNSEAKTEREKKLKEVLVAKSLRHLREETQKITKSKIYSPEDIMGNFAGTPEEFFKSDKGYREEAVDAAQEIINQWWEEEGFIETEIQSYRDFRITNGVFFFPKINPKTFNVECKKIDGNDVVFDINIEDDFGRGCQYFSLMDYVSKSSLFEEFPDIDREEIENLMRGNNYGLTSIKFPQWGYKNTRQKDGVNYILVARSYFIAPREFYNLSDSDGYHENIKFKKGKELYNKSADSKIEKYAMQQIYYTNLIGGCIEGSGGVLKNQYRPTDNPAKAVLPIFMFLPNFIDFKAISEPMRIQELQKTLNMLWYKFKEMVADAKGMILGVDESKLTINPVTKLPDFNLFMKHLQANKIRFYNSSAIGKNFDDPDSRSAKDQIEWADLGMSKSAMDILTAIPVVEEKIQEILGMNPSRTGDVNKYESVRNAALNKTQSDFITAYPNWGFDRTIEKTLTYLANLLKISTRLKKDNKIYISDTSRRLIESDDSTFYDLGIEVRKRRNRLEMEQYFDMVISLSLQGAQTPSIIRLGAKLKNADTIDEKIKIMDDTLDKEEQKQLQAQFAQQQLQQQMALQQQQQQHEQTMQRGVQEAGIDMAKQRQKADQQQENTALSQGMNIASQQMQGEQAPS